ncbi:MAG TPA: hypothetical protein VFN56_02495 [Candidatus Saccharimonadales bacterium]|nr:hypothetical protein [Candidatus Saccharimonadales bacterium]
MATSHELIVNDRYIDIGPRPGQPHTSNQIQWSAIIQKEVTSSINEGSSSCDTDSSSHVSDPVMQQPSDIELTQDTTDNGLTLSKEPRENLYRHHERSQQQTNANVIKSKKSYLGSIIGAASLGIGVPVVGAAYASVGMETAAASTVLATTSSCSFSPKTNDNQQEYHSAYTPNPTTASYKGESVSILASKSGLSFSYAGYPTTIDEEEYIHMENVTTGEFVSGFPQISGGSCTDQLQLASGDWVGYSTLTTGGGQEFVNFDLQAGGTSSNNGCPTGINHAAPGEPWAVAATKEQVNGETCPGYWVGTRDGGVTSIGAAKWLGDVANLRLNAPIVGITATPDDGGYWLVASDGGIFSFGDAHFYGSTGGIRLNEPVVGMAATHDALGYWLVASDGGIFSFGDSHFFGSMGNVKLAAPIVGMTAQPDGKGYRMVGSDGGVFDFGDAAYYGSLPGEHVENPNVTTMAPSIDGKGYYLINALGNIWAFGDAPNLGNA